MGLSQSRRTDLMLVLLLIISFLISLYLSLMILDYLHHYPHACLKYVVEFIGRQRRGSWHARSHEDILEQGAFFLPFFIFGSISFLIYFKYLKGQIIRSAVLYQQKIQTFKLFLISLPIAIIIILLVALLMRIGII